MKNGKRPTVKQKQLMAAAGLDPLQWLVTKDQTDRLSLVNRRTKKEEVVNK